MSDNNTEKRLISLLGQLTRALDDFGQSSASKARKKSKTISQLFEDTERVINVIDAENRQLPALERSKRIAETREKRNLLRQLKRRFRDMQYEMKHGKKMAELQDKSKKQRNQLLKNQNDLEAADESLDNTLRMAQDAKQVGTGILAEVRRQNDVMTDTNNKVSGINSKRKRGVKMVKEMSRRERYIRSCQCCCFVVQLVIILFLVWLRLVNPLVKCIPVIGTYASTYALMVFVTNGKDFISPDCLSHP
ncbi:hypothetical protein J8273_2111 [Carpediemonas membranifera]|uniref:t-SNARE coiled-coil homology domain-containing protein n=1 Tax=Carpediemonas membranifera TaxID=201153 RepID=A0A8J6B001_9EUKA|nr:hypothetical protein J8273_2111 [Carpediemonas membranifera]|eukprot:KAG9396380.1 hypothetical protein J8273_2111 [Carpediemonas membranifera]